MKYMPFSQFTNIKKIAVGGFSIVYQATLLDSNKTIVLKRFKNTQYAEEYFLREVNTLNVKKIRIYFIKILILILKFLAEVVS
jgi:serine/threonine protein kinase